MTGGPAPGYVWTCPAPAWDNMFRNLLDAAGLAARAARAETILIKPNLVNAHEPPVTTPVGLVAALVRYLRRVTGARILIGEGTAAAEHDTWQVFESLGYVELAQSEKIELIDLNSEESVALTRPDCRRWPDMHLPAIALESFLISVPVLKAHTLAGVTLSLKNMMGLAPPAHYQQGSGWKKAAFHHRIHEAIADLNRYRLPDFTLLDASVGMAESHLWGATCQPPVGLLAAGSDPVAIDAWGCGMLDKNWQEIGHINMLHGELGQAEPLQVVPLGPQVSQRSPRKTVTYRECGMTTSKTPRTD